MPDRPRVPDALPRRFRRRPPRAPRPRRGRDPSRSPRQGRVHVHADGRRRHGRARGALRLEVLQTPGHSPGVDLDSGPRPRVQRRGAVRGADGRHAVHRRRRPAGSARVTRLERRRARRHAVRLAAHEAGAAARRDARLSRPRRRLAVREDAEHRHGLDDRRAAPLQLRASADEPRTVHRDRDRRPARRAGVLHLRRRPQHAGAPTRSTRRSARRAESALAAGGAGGRGGRRSAARHP